MPCEASLFDQVFYLRSREEQRKREGEEETARERQAEETGSSTDSRSIGSVSSLEEQTSKLV